MEIGTIYFNMNTRTGLVGLYVAMLKTDTGEVVLAAKDQPLYAQPPTPAALWMDVQGVDGIHSTGARVVCPLCAHHDEVYIAVAPGLYVLTHTEGKSTLVGQDGTHYDLGMTAEPF